MGRIGILNICTFNTTTLPSSKTLHNMKATFKEITYNSTEWVDAVKLREKILREPLGSYFTKQELAEEKNHIQVAGFINNTLVATAVLVPEGEAMKMQRVVVAENLRGLNIGTEMMLFCERFALSHKAHLIYCHARDTAVNFYLKNGYQGMGNYFDEDGIPHLKMTKTI